MLTIRGLSKRFGSTPALCGVDLDAAAGEVTAVIGENGAGKSTLMQILAGAVRADGGTIRLGEDPYRPLDPAHARRAGVALVPQEPELIADLDVTDNILLGREPARFGIVQRAKARELAAKALALVTMDDQSVALDQLARLLGPSERQRVAIARAMSQPDLRLLIFDEPTSSLTRADAKRVFQVIERLAQGGLTVLYVSHFLEEVLSIANAYVVLRDGQSISHGRIADSSASALVCAMAGENVSEHVRRKGRPPGDVVLELRALTGAAQPFEIDLQLRAGEVLGIWGLVGAGRTELLRTIFGLSPIRSGKLRLGTLEGPLTPRTSLTHGLGLLSEDRRHEGLAQTLSIADNITLSKLPGHGPFVTKDRQVAAVAPRIRELGIRCRDPLQRVAELSGGNQQKVALARLLHQDVDVLLLDEPTRGIDVRSRADVHACIDSLTRQGKSVLLVSSYLPELLSLSDRIAVMFRGRLGPPQPTEQWNEHSLLMHATGSG